MLSETKPASAWTRPLPIATTAAALVVVVACLLPLASGFGFTVSGVNTNDGKIAFVLALLGLAAFGLAPFRIAFACTQAVLAALVALIGIVDLIDFERTLAGAGFSGGAGAGLYLTAAAGTAWLVLALVSLRQRSNSGATR